MRTPEDTTAPSGSVPARSVLGRLITPWEYRHLHEVAAVRFAAGGFHLGIGVVLLGLGHRAGTDPERRKCYGWAAWFLALSALLFSGGYVDVAVARSAPPPTSGRPGAADTVPVT